MIILDKKHYKGELMKKLTPLQEETMAYCKKKIDEARELEIDFKKIKKRDQYRVEQILEAQSGIVYTQGGRCTIKTLRVLEERGLLKVLEDNSGIGTSGGAFPSKVQILNY